MIFIKLIHISRFALQSQQIRLYPSKLVYVKYQDCSERGMGVQEGVGAGLGERWENKINNTPRMLNRCFPCLLMLLASSYAYLELIKRAVNI